MPADVVSRARDWQLGELAGKGGNLSSARKAKDQRWSSVVQFAKSHGESGGELRGKGH